MVSNSHQSLELSNRLNSTCSETVAKFNLSEINLGRVIGRGGFSRVYEIRDITLSSSISSAISAQQQTLRSEIARTCIDPLTGNSHYVLKTLRPDLPDSERTKGIIDLAVEARFLASLSHRNIINMRGTAPDGEHLEPTFFVVLERLVQTMDERMSVWRRDVGKGRGIWWCCFGYCLSNKPKLHQIWMERLTIARDLARAIRYLHHEDVVFRDLKPDNIGFDEEGKVKIFDFGLAKRLHPDDKTADDLYRLTGNTGSLRYMAPEVASGLPYNNRVDVYSFGILLWQICSLSTPYAGYSCKMHADLVVGKGYRPKIDTSWPDSWSRLMSDCWSTDIFSRPDFNKIVNVLDGEISALLTDDGVLPGRLTKIKAKAKKQRKVDGSMMDLDTRLAEGAQVLDPTERMHDQDII